MMAEKNFCSSFRSLSLTEDTNIKFLPEPPFLEISDTVGRPKTTPKATIIITIMIANDITITILFPEKKSKIQWSLAYYDESVSK